MGFILEFAYFKMCFDIHFLLDSEQCNTGPSFSGFSFLYCTLAHHFFGQTFYPSALCTATLISPSFSGFAFFIHVYLVHSFPVLHFLVLHFTTPQHIMIRVFIERHACYCPRYKILVVWLTVLYLRFWRTWCMYICHAYNEDLILYNMWHVY